MSNPLIISDFVECEGCGAEIEHLIVNGMTPWRNDPDYKLCESCVEQRDAIVENSPDED